MSLSVTAIVPTKDRAADLARLMESLGAQTVPPQEVIVIDQSCRDDSLASIEPIARRYGLNLIYRRDDSVTGGAAARNRAMDLAIGAIWLFLDDDVVLESRFVEELLRGYSICPHACGVSGIITNYSRPGRAFLFWARCFVRGPFHDDRQPIYWAAGQLKDADPISVSRFGGGLMSFRADAVRTVRFDENLQGVCDGEDVDFCMRIPGNPQLVIAPRARLAHNHSASGRIQSHWVRRNARGHFFLFLKHWNHGVRDRLCAAWLLVGYSLVVAFAGIRSWSLNPFRALRTGMVEARSPVASALHR